MTSPLEHQPLVRALGRRDLIGILINSMVGSGMLAAPAKVFALADGWSLGVLGLSALIVVPLILCFAELGSRFSGTGGPYLYAREALPGWMAFSVGWMLWISPAFAAATLTNLLVSYVAGFIPMLGSGWGRACVVIALGAGFTFVALRGIRQSVGVSNLLVVLKIGFILAFIAGGIAFIQPDRFTIVSPPPGPTTLAQAILIYLFAYTGFERAGVVAGEARNPQRDVPGALLASVAIATLAYGGVLLVCIGVLGDPSGTDRPLAEVGRQLFGPAGAAAVSAGAIVVILGTLSVLLVAMPRLLLAIAEQGQLPQFLGAVHPRWRTPHVAIVVSSVLAFGLALGSDLLVSLTFATATRVICYILCCVAVVRLSRRADAPPAQFNLPGRTAVAILSAAIFTVVLLVGATKELPTLGMILAIGLAIFALTTRRRPALQPTSPPAP